MTMYGTKLPYRTTDANNKKLDASRAWTPEDVEDFLDQIRTGRYTHPYASPEILVETIDPITGDSTLHIAAKSISPLDTINTIMSGFPPGSCDGRDWCFFDRWAYHALLAHQNYDGDTVFHIAARSGNKLLLTMLYRYVTGHWSASCPEEIEMDDGPPEHDIYPHDTDDWLSAPRLLFLITKNKMGRDPAAEARFSGNGELAEWLDAIIPRLDPDGTRLTEANVAKMIELVKHTHCHNWAKEQDTHNQFGS